MNAITVTRENVLNLSNTDLKEYLKKNGIKATVTKATRSEAEAKALALFATAEAAAPAPEAPEAAAPAPEAAAPETSGGAVVVIAPAPEAGSEAEAGSEEEGESEAEAAARIEAEAAAEAKAAEETEARAKARASNSIGVSLSWRNPEVRAARLTRDGVSVIGTDKDGNKVAEGSFKSTKEAFRLYRLPLEKHIKFRLNLKSSRREVIEKDGIKYEFTMA